MLDCALNIYDITLVLKPVQIVHHDTTIAVLLLVFKTGHHDTTNAVWLLVR